MSGLGEEAAPEMQGVIGVDPTETCKEVALPGVNGLLFLIVAVVVGRVYLEVYAVGPEKTLDGLGALVVNAKDRGIEAMVMEVLSEACLCSH